MLLFIVVCAIVVVSIYSAGLYLYSKTSSIGKEGVLIYTSSYLISLGAGLIIFPLLLR